MLLSNKEFLAQLKELFDATKSKGSVFLTQKRFTFEEPASLDAGEDTVMGEASGSVPVTRRDEGEAREWPCLVRATDGNSKKDGKKVKLSTLVQPVDYLAFTTLYGTLLKASFSSLLKKKSKSKATKAVLPGGVKGKGVKGKGDSPFQLTKVIGPRRGSGHSKRVRLIKRRAKELGLLMQKRKRDAMGGMGV